MLQKRFECREDGGNCSLTFSYEIIGDLIIIKDVQLGCRGNMVGDIREFAFESMSKFEEELRKNNPKYRFVKINFNNWLNLQECFYTR